MSLLSKEIYKKRRIINKMIGFSTMKLILLVFFLTISFIISLIAIWFCINTNNLINMNKVKNLSTRSLSTTNIPLDIEALLGVSNIIAIQPYSARHSYNILKIDYENQKLNVESFCVGVNNTTINSLFDKDYNISENNAIIPSRFITLDGKYIEGENLIGKQIEIEVIEYDFSTQTPTPVKTHLVPITVCDTYDSNEIVSQENQIFLDYKVIQKLNKLNEGNLSEYQEQDNSTIIVVDNYDNLDKVANSINELGYQTRRVYKFNTLNTRLFSWVSIIITTLVLFFSIILLCFALMKTINNKKNEYGLMKAIGFTNVAITQHMLITIISIITVSFITAFFFSFYITDTLKNSIFPAYINPTILNSTIVIYSVLGVILSLIVTIWGLVKITKLSPVNAMREVE